MNNCKHERTVYIVETNTFPYGDTLEYDKCVICGKLLHMQVKLKEECSEQSFDYTRAVI
jgi:hypothetical protein